MAVIKGEQLKALQYVFVNGKRIVAEVVALDREQGWVDIKLPVLPKKEVEAKTPAKKDDDPMKTGKFGWTTRRLHGKVEVREFMPNGTSTSTRN